MVIQLANNNHGDSSCVKKYSYHEENIRKPLKGHWIGFPMGTSEHWKPCQRIFPNERWRVNPVIFPHRSSEHGGDGSRSIRSIWVDFITTERPSPGNHGEFE